MAIVEEQPTDKVYMWMVFLTTTAWAVIITLAVLAGPTVAYRSLRSPRAISMSMSWIMPFIWPMA